MNKQDTYFAIFVGALTAAATDSFPLLNLINCFCCLGIISGGILPIWLLSKKLEDRAFFTTPEVIHIGLSAGLVGAVMAFILQFIVYQFYGNWQVEWLTQALESMEDLPPLWEDLYYELQKPEYQGFAGMAILIRNLIMFPVFTLLGSFLMNKFLIKRSSK
ncbi:hypothetical protein Calab_1490 [Caldithrix abyssi DSM 13497]|uniref:DUF4199 domain-containing protein n=1 Tax=Caldithrix abyssi DSM 13497 TaxID=880073 RepID=H1XPY5_CALAY|nr:hypothetical protein [Caldithrix abyssi]APF20360.1 hypothetical protein Cabys_3614 [Caldithrix abyssi DSM 13497]EHO41111.1 hypothetical protein Calab_1490 [Caldithrix abyssi DSM 13497]